MLRPWLSVIVPTYNGSRYLQCALESIIGQGDGEIEVIAVDDGSTDSTMEILRSYVSRIRMTVIEREHEGNWTATTNVGMSAARGRYLCWLHQDDAWLPKRLERLRALVAAYPQAALIVHPCWYMDCTGRRIGYWHCPLPRRSRGLQPAEVLERLIVQCFVATCAPAFSAQAAGQAGRLDEGLRYAADWDYWLRLARLGTIVYHPTPLAAFRLHDMAQTLSCARQVDDFHAQQELVIKRHLHDGTDWGRNRPALERAAQFSVDMNAALAATFAGGRPIWSRLVWRFCQLGPGGWRRYLRDSRLIERCVSRLQAGAVRWRSEHRVKQRELASINFQGLAMRSGRS